MCLCYNGEKKVFLVMQQYVEIVQNLHKVAGRKRHLDWLLLGSSAAYNLAGLLPPLATAGIIRVIAENNFDGIWMYAGMYVGFYALYFGFMRVNNYAYTRIAEFYHITLQERIFRNVEEHPELLEKLPRGQVMDTFADDIRWMVDGMNVATEALLQMLRLIIIFGVFLTQDLTAGVIAVLVDMLYLLVLNDNAKEEARSYASARRAEDKAISAFSEMAEGKEERWIVMERSFPGWKREYRKKRRAIANRNTLWAGIPYLGKIVLYILLAKMVIDGEMRVDILVLLIGYFEMTITCMDKLTAHLLDLSNYGVRVERIKKLIL